MAEAWRNRESLRSNFVGKRLEEHGCEIVHVALLRGAALLTLRRFADAVAAQFDHVAHGKDIARLNVFVNEAMGVQHIERRHETVCQLRNILDGQMALVKDPGQIRVHVLKDGIEDRAAIKLVWPEVLEPEKVRMAQRIHRTPAGKNLILIEVALDEAHHCWLAPGAGGGKERAAASATEAFARGKRRR